MNRSLRLFSVFFLLVLSVRAYSEDPEPVGIIRRHEMMPGLRRRAVVLDIDARVLEQAEQELVVIWNETHSKLAIPGSPVSIKLVGSNLVVAVQFTPFIRRHGQNVLVAQGQIWLDVPNEGIRYYTSIQTIPLEFDEPIYFFPLGQSHQLAPAAELQSSEGSRSVASIEIMITVKPYTEAGAPQAEEAAYTGNSE